MAAEREARLAAAWKISGMVNAPPLQKAAPRLPASRMYSHRPASPQMAPQMEPNVPSTDAVGAFIAWQLAQGDKAKGKHKAPPHPIPPGLGAQGQGKGLGGDPFVLRARGAGRGGSRERHDPRDRYNKRNRYERDDREEYVPRAPGRPPASAVQ